MKATLWWVLLLLFALGSGCSDEGGSGSQLNCATGQQACNGLCVDTTSDGDNCGGCALVCPTGTECSGAACRAPDGSVVAAISVDVPTSCPEGRIPCGARCVDPMGDDDHCGTCGAPCLAGQVCELGACRDIGAGCPAGKTLCGDRCADLSTDAEHCGMCDNSCGAGTCSSGACSCTASDTPCGLGCASVMTDPENCGSCEHACGELQSCVAGSCRCPAGQSMCGDACFDLSSDPTHCGTCETACAPGQACTQGMCHCPVGLELCASGCVDLASSVTDCGACGEACTGGQICNAGSCACPSGESLCNGTCTDLLMDAANCGTCGIACAADEVCNGGSCVCPEGQISCDDTCVDTATSTEHCGGCGMACTGGQICNASMCECPEGETLCADTCVDTQADDLNCGGCGMECSGGQTCQEGMCECPAGQTFCDGACIDTLTDDLNCGGCGTACGLGQLCNEGSCQGGGLGDDGCQGVAENVSLSKLSVYQTVEIPLMQGGDEVGDRNVDVVAGRDTVVRVFVETGSGWTPRELSARLFLDDGTERFTIYPEAPVQISGSSSDDDRESTFELFIEGEQLRPDMRYAVEIVECGTPPGEAVTSPRFPSEEGAELGAVVAGALRIYLVPLESNGRMPDTSEAALDVLRDGFMASYPIDSLELEVSESYEVSNAQDWVGNLEGLRNLRISDAPDPAVYYYGLLRPTETIREFCGGGCTAGIGYVPQGTGGFAESGRVSLGLAYGDEESVRTALHEIGHNHGRNHAPCVPRGASIDGVDPNFPYENAAIGVWGYDQRSDSFIPPDAPDIMAYCDNPWFSDYTYRGLLSTTLAVNGTQQSVIVDPARVAEFWVLIVEPNQSPRWGAPRPGVSTADGVAVPAEVLDASGGVVAKVDVYKNLMSHHDAFSLDVPAPRLGWSAIRVPGVGLVRF